MNETMKFFKKNSDKVTRVINKITKNLLVDESIVIHPTVITIDMINNFKARNDSEDILELSNVYRITHNRSNSSIFYFVVVQKRYGRTFKHKKFLLLNRNLSTISEYSFADRVIDITISVCNQVLNNL